MRVRSQARNKLKKWGDQDWKTKEQHDKDTKKKD